MDGMFFVVTRASPKKISEIAAPASISLAAGNRALYK
jgi:hypothetical protein